MVKKIIWTPGRTFSEFSLLPDGLTTDECSIDKVRLETILAGIKLKIPLISAAMMSVTGYEMALELGRRGGIGILPNKLQISDQADIVKRIKDYQMEFVEDPVRAEETETIGQVIEKVEKHGHSTIPVVDRYQNFKGMFTQERLWETNRSMNEKVSVAMMPYNPDGCEIEVCTNPNITLEEVKKIFEQTDSSYVVVLDEQGRLAKLAFKQDVEDIKVGAAISTHKGWQERVEANIAAGVSLISVDSSDGYAQFQGDLIKEYKSNPNFAKVPICAGNVVTANGVIYLIDSGADIVKLGMSSGSICSTRREKAVGRATMSALLASVKARNEYQIKKERYVPLIWDGGASCAADFIIALTLADAVMAGGYFNHFYESAGEKYDAAGNITEDERDMKWVATWGEGSARARNLDRYGQSRRTFFTEGEEGKVPYWGRLKPYLERDINKIKAAISNTGSSNLEELRKNAVLELMSPASQGIVGNIHNMEVVDKK